MQKDHRHAPGLFLIGQAKAGQRQLDTRVRAVAGLQAVDVLAQVAATFGPEQGYGK